MNLGRIISCERTKTAENTELIHRIPPRKRRVIFELEDERNALERVLLHFCTFPKKGRKKLRKTDTISWWIMIKMTRQRW